jgi:hypothetical protein
MFSVPADHVLSSLHLAYDFFRFVSGSHMEAAPAVAALAPKDFGLVGGYRNPLGVSVPGDRGVPWREDVVTETDATVLVDTCRVVRIVCCNGFYHLPPVPTGSTMKGGKVCWRWLSCAKASS